MTNLTEKKLLENRYNQLRNKKELNSNEVFEFNLLKKVLKLKKF